MRTFIFLFVLMPLLSSAQRITYNWLNAPCAVLLNCDSGCTACNLPVNESILFTGTNAAFNNVQVCPHPVSPADNALSTFGWPAIQEASHAVLITGIAFQPTFIDSMVIRHRTSVDGPARLEVRFSVNGSLGDPPVADIALDENMNDLVLTDLGSVQAEGEMAYGFFQLELRAYQGATGSWDLDAVRIVGSHSMDTGIHEHGAVEQATGSGVDMLGREIGTFIASGAYIDGRRKVRSVR